MSNWYVKKCGVSSTKLMEFYGVKKPLAYALYHRKIRNKDRIKNYINTEEYNFQNINDLRDVVKAYSIIQRALKANKKICIYGDYDADGVMSTTIMYKALKALGANVHYFIPDRVEDGYGLNENAVKDIINNGTELIITCDNGISALNQIDIAKSMGIEVIVLDHHEPVVENETEVLPKADAIVDAKIKNCGYSFTQMCAGGLCYRFVCGLYEYLGKELVNKREFCELASVATICDVVDLIEDNRAIASQGLKFINEGSSNLGLRTLIKIKEIKEINSYTVGFVVGPCINASGRLDSAKIAVELFVTENEVRANELANDLNDFNEKRKAITQDSLERIIDNIENTALINDKIIVVYDENTHESVAGIIAGRIKERYSRPAIVLTNASDGVKGSGRSVEKYNMFKGLTEVKYLLNKFGGHTMAAGLSLDKENIDIFRKSINDNCFLSIKELEPGIRAESVLGLGDINIDSIYELNILAPFGKGNERPIYALKSVNVTNIRFVGQEKNIVSLVITDGKDRIRAVDFNNCDLWKEYLSVNGYDEESVNGAFFVIDAMCFLDINEYKGYRNPQIIIKDVRF